MQRGKCDDPNPKTSSRYSKYAGTFLVRLDFPPAPDPKPARQVVEILDPRPGRGRQQQDLTALPPKPLDNAIEALLRPLIGWDRAAPGSRPDRSRQFYRMVKS